ncbi:YggS family pyridoxal phosphate-dependent enzyme [Metabacillus fastidiosus]|nr:YggS family pyridoxal phosphate-dependent enzyme [Metabacillus fastidiosus]MED4452788.1 YggS family pyridoxal phosphate-dependent enzyme [Metabacillus fastidiosus]
MTVNVGENAEKIRTEIKEICRKINRDPNEIKIVAVTKYVSIDRAKAAIDAGITHLGENREEGLSEKFAAIENDVTWHFIGSLQTRKVKNIIDKVEYIHSLDRLSLAEEINKRADKTMKCFVQVNVSGEESKQGLTPDEVIGFIEQLQKFEYIQIEGLMTMAPYTSDEAIIKNCFRDLKQLQLNVQALQLSYAPCKELSMGMSNDYKIAIEEGATFIRIGSSLVGNEVRGE